MNYTVLVEWPNKKQTLYMMPASSEIEAALLVGAHWHNELSGNFKLLSVFESAPIAESQYPLADSTAPPAGPKESL